MLELQQDSQELLAQIKALKRQIGDQQNNDDDKNISMLRSALKMDHQDGHLDLPAYRRLLNRVFADIETGHENTRLLTWRRLSSEPVMHQWLHHAGSSVVILAGRNWEAVNNVTLSWLSYGSILAVEHCRQASDVVTAYYFCQTSPVAVGHRRVTVQDVGASLLYQIARQVPKALRAGVEDVRQAAGGALWKSDDDMEALNAIGGALLRLLSFIGTETVVFILDRLNQCQADNTAGGAWRADLKDLMTWILSIVAEAGCVLKVLIVLRPNSSEGFLSQRQRIKQLESGSYFEKLDWHQNDGT
ncbi:hypothetical protein GE09DRAFT_1227456 [Coniochaeta sp. 2T2.1]|nr:hypothetical protein GE09DRAFT_1227456 [Coniochaeta sp. 2T2.1]